MALLDLSGAAKGVGKVANGVVMLVAPVGSLLEMASKSSSAWSDEHAANVDAKAFTQASTREVRHTQAHRKAMLATQELVTKVNVIERETEDAVIIDSVRHDLHTDNMRLLSNISAEVRAQLRRQTNLSDEDIRKAAGVGSAARASTSTPEPASVFDLSKYQTA